MLPFSFSNAAEALMDKQQLLDFIATNRLGVLSTIGPKGEPQSALVGMAVTPEFEIVFDTVKKSRKFANCNGRAIPLRIARKSRGSKQINGD